MKPRRKMSRRSSRRSFTKNAMRVHKKNLRLAPMRGGFRL